MSYQKRRRRHGRRYDNTQRQEPSLMKMYLFLAAAKIEPYPATEAGRRLRKYILPRDDNYVYASVAFEEERQLRGYLEQGPDVIILLVRLQDLLGATFFYQQLEETKAKHPGYQPDVIVWEVAPPPGKIPAMFPKFAATMHHSNPVLIDILLNRSERNVLN